jgi:ABC-type glutathione transport system ATPase component
MKRWRGNFMEILKAENLVKTFPISDRQRKTLGIEEKKKTAVAGISFTAKSGEIFGLFTGTKAEGVAGNLCHSRSEVCHLR